MSQADETRARRAGKPPSLGIALWCVSWFVPVFKGQDMFGSLGELAKGLDAKPDAMVTSLSGSGWVPGWSACRFAWELLWSEPQPGKLEGWQQRLCGASCLTNIAMLIAIVAVMMGSRRPGLGLLLLGCAAVNSSWMWTVDANPFDWLRVGYFLWLLAFVITGLCIYGAGRAR